MKKTICGLLFVTFCTAAHAQEPKQGQWDGKTERAALSGAYEDPRQVPPTFGILSYFNAPWRGYMDTWPASRWLQFPGVGWTGDAKYQPAQAQLMGECGVRFVRLEIGWGSLNWDDELPPHIKERLVKQLALCRKYTLRPLILLNAHHGAPCPMRGFEAQLLEEAKQGARQIKIAPETAVREGYTGLVNQGDYKAAFPLVIKFENGLATLSAPLPKDLKAGKLPLIELKYQPLQGAKLQDGTSVAASQETLDGWRKYVRAVGNFVRENVGNADDSGFDIEVWNEMTFGSDFLDINRYYEPKRDYAEPLVYRKTRVWSPRLRPDAKLQFEQKGAEVLLPVTVDFFNDGANGFKNVAVISGFSNQRPWDSGAQMWDGQSGLSKHYYTGSNLREVSPQTPLGHKDSATVDALDQFDGIKDPKNPEWHGIMAGSNFVPSVTLSLPEWMFFAFQTETVQRDLFPDSRVAKGIGNAPFGRYTNSGDYRIPRYWQTEVNYDRSAFIERVKKESGAANDDPRLIKLNDWTNSKFMLRQYLFQCHKGFERIFLFSTAFDDFLIGLLPQAFYKALDANNFELNNAVRQTVPQGWWATKWVTDLMKTAAPLEVTRPLRVDELIEHKPRLVFKGDGSAAHPDKYHRDYFAFLPFQLSPQKFAIAYYVATPNATQAWDKSKDALDSARYDLPPQDFDVTIGNLAGRGAKISAFDPLKNQSVPVGVLKSDLTNLQVRLPSTDYPRFLIVEEAQPGPQIIAPTISAAPGKITLKWKTNVVPGAVRVTYGRDWTSRDVNETKITPRKNQRDFEITLPTGDADMAAARIRIAANGLSTLWPRWDEDPAGQITMPDAKPRPLNQASTPIATTVLPISDFTAPVGISLPGSETLGDLQLNLPADVVMQNNGNERVWIWGKAPQKITLNARLVPRGAKNADDYLPFASPIDTVSRRCVKLPSGLEAEAVDFVFDATAHPGLSDLEQRFLLVPRGADLVILKASGPPLAMKAGAKTIDAIWASVKSG